VGDEYNDVLQWGIICQTNYIHNTVDGDMGTVYSGTEPEAATFSSCQLYWSYKDEQLISTQVEPTSLLQEMQHIAAGDVSMFYTLAYKSLPGNVQ
jgi:hypothetical protein